jgi:hypothetical protein
LAVEIRRCIVVHGVVQVRPAIDYEERSELLVAGGRRLHGQFAAFVPALLSKPVPGQRQAAMHDDTAAFTLLAGPMDTVHWCE